ncbi:MAG: right-handed parallel beta-helix repeat-containing protein, partial [Burkholderiaceae bacterium]
AEPPRGIHHHYARLAIWDAGSTAEPTDCRHSWPPRGGADCACTQCVHPEDHNSGAFTIGDAIRRVQETGGTVCLQAGVYQVSEPIRLTNARSVRVHGQGAATVLSATRGAFSIESGMGLSIDSLSIVSTESGVRAIAVNSVLGLALHDLVILVNDPRVTGAAIGLTGAVGGLTIRDNLIVAPLGIVATGSTPNDEPRLATLAVRIEDNILWCRRHCIELAGAVTHLFSTQIKGNEVLGGQDSGISLLGSGLPSSSVRIEANSLSVNGPGIRCATEGVWLEGNKVVAVVQNERQPRGSGISLVTANNPDGLDKCQILSNQVSGFPDAGILIDAPCQDLICKLNIVDLCGNGILVTNSSGGSASIENNHVSDIGHGRARPELGSFIHGISVQRLDNANVVGNTIRRVGLQAVSGINSVAGIAHFAVRRSRIAGNTVLEVGPATAVSGLTLSGLFLQGPYTDNDISNNVVERDGTAAASDGAAWSAIRAFEPGERRPILHAANFTTVHLSAARMLVVNATHAFTIDAPLEFTRAAAAPVPRRSSATVRANILQSRGASPAIEIETGADIHFADNRCTSTGEVPAVTLTAPAAVVTSNIIRSGGDIAVSLTVSPDRAVIMGNATRGQILIVQKPVSTTQWANFNVGLD